MATAAGHPLAVCDNVNFADTLEYEYISLYDGSVIHSFVHQAAGPQTRSLKTRIQVSNFDSVCRMIEASVGIGLLPESAAQHHARSMDLNILRLSDEWAMRKVIICVRELDALPGFARAGGTAGGEWRGVAVWRRQRAACRRRRYYLRYFIVATAVATSRLPSSQASPREKKIDLPPRSTSPVAVRMRPTPFERKLVVSDSVTACRGVP